MSGESIIETIPENGTGKTAVITSWLSGWLVAAVVGYIGFSAALILTLESFEDAKRQAQEAKAAVETTHKELTSLQSEVDSLKKQKEVLAPTLADWEKRLKEKAEAKAVLDALESKRQQVEADISQVAKRLSDANKSLADTEKQKVELSSEIEKLKAEGSVWQVVEKARASAGQFTSCVNPLCRLPLAYGRRRGHLLPPIEAPQPNLAAAQQAKQQQYDRVFVG